MLNDFGSEVRNLRVKEENRIQRKKEKNKIQNKNNCNTEASFESQRTNRE